jgi:hypothetical protein
MFVEMEMGGTEDGADKVGGFEPKKDANGFVSRELVAVSD